MAKNRRQLLVRFVTIGLVLTALIGLQWLGVDVDEYRHHHSDSAASTSVEQPRELIVVTVSEYGDNSFTIDVTPSGILNQLHPGQTYDVLIVNSGGIAHELMVMPATMPQASHDHMENMSLLSVDTDQLSHRGAIVQGEITFPEVGEYTFICHLHPGMETTVTVIS